LGGGDGSRRVMRAFPLLVPVRNSQSALAVTDAGRYETF